MAPFDAVPYAQFNAWALQLKILCQSTWFSQCIGLWRPVWMLGNVSFRLVGKMDARLLGQGCLRENLPVLETWSSNVQKFSRSKSWNCGRFGRLSYTHLSAFRFSLSGCNQKMPWLWHVSTIMEERRRPAAEEEANLILSWAPPCSFSLWKFGRRIFSATKSSN